MNPTRKRTFLRLAIILVAGAAVLLWAANQRSRSVVIENRSRQTIKILNVTIAEETRTFRDVPDGESMSETFQAGSGARFKIEGRLADETRIRFTGKAGNDLHYLILPGGAMMPRPKKDAAR